MEHKSNFQKKVDQKKKNTASSDRAYKQRQEIKNIKAAEATRVSS